MQGYLGRERHDTFDPDEWFATGDLFHVDEAGLHYFHGRAGSMIKTAGANVSPREVEAEIADITGCTAIVIGLPDAERGQRVAAVVVSTDPVDLERLQAALRERLSSYKVPRTFLQLRQDGRSPHVERQARPARAEEALRWTLRRRRSRPSSPTAPPLRRDDRARPRRRRRSPMPSSTNAAGRSRAGWSRPASANTPESRCSRRTGSTGRSSPTPRFASAPSWSRCRPSCDRRSSSRSCDRPRSHTSSRVRGYRGRDYLAELESIVPGSRRGDEGGATHDGASGAPGHLGDRRAAPSSSASRAIVEALGTIRASRRRARHPVHLGQPECAEGSPAYARQRPAGRRERPRRALHRPR